MLNISSLKYSLICLIGSILISPVIGFFLHLLIENETYYFLIIFIIICPISGFILWNIIIENKKKYNYLRAVICGIITISITHIFTIFVYLVISYTYELFTNTKPGIMYVEIINLIVSLPFSIAVGIFSLIVLFGWFTIPLGIVLTIAYMYNIKLSLNKEEGGKKSPNKA